MKDLFIFCGEPSGDALGAELIKELTSLSLIGVPGPKMRKYPIEPVLQMEQFEVMGFSQVLFNLYPIIKQFYLVKNAILEKKPKAVVLIDYPDFNLRLARSLKKSGYTGKIIQYVSPSVWAWRKNRIPFMEKSLDLLLTLFPFEKKLFNPKKLTVQYVGHPLAYKIKHQKLEIDGFFKHYPHLKNKKILAIFPGSRRKEIEGQLEKAVRIAKEQKNVNIAISYTSDTLLEIIQEKLSNNPSITLIPAHFSQELMHLSYAAIATSGTVNLELSLHKTPTLVLYHISSFNRFIAKYLFKISLDHYSIVNILAEEEIFPESIERPKSDQTCIDIVSKLLEKSPLRDKALKGCETIIEKLAFNDPAKQSAQAILELL